MAIRWNWLVQERAGLGKPTRNREGRSASKCEPLGSSKLSSVFDAPLAHSVEQRTFNPLVEGSKPSRCTSDQPGPTARAFPLGIRTAQLSLFRRPVCQVRSSGLFWIAKLEAIGIGRKGFASNTQQASRNLTSPGSGTFRAPFPFAT